MAESSTLRRVSSGFKSMLAANAVRVVAKGLVVLLLARVFLEPGEYGLLFFAMSVLQVAMLFSYFGLAKSGARFIAEFRETNPGQIPHVLRTTLRYNLVTTAVVAGALVAFAAPIATLLEEPRLTPFLVLGAGYVVVKTLLTFCTLSFQGFNRTSWSALVKSVSSVGLLAFAVGFVAVGFGPLGALAGYAVGAGIAALVGFYLLYTRFYSQYDADPEPDAGLARRILRYSVPLTLTRGAHSLDRQVDTILVGYFLTSVAVSYYTLAKQIADFVIAPASSLGFAISPAYGKWQANDDVDTVARTYETSLIYVALLYLPAAVGLALVAEPLVSYVFSDYAEAAPVVAVFGAYVLLRAIDKITNDGLDYLGLARSRAIAKSGASLANVALNLVLIPTVGVVGAAAATVTTQGLLVAVELGIIHRHLGLNVGRLLRGGATVCLVTGGMTASVVLLLPYVAGLASLFAVVAVAVCAWAALSVASGLVDVAAVENFVRGAGAED